LAGHDAGRAAVTLIGNLDEVEVGAEWQATKEALGALRPEFPRDIGIKLIVTCYMSRDFREGIDAFLNKRPSSFRGE
jgi:hypothetical protein